MKPTPLAALLLAPVLAAAQSTVYLIRHGEKPSSGNGLSAQGQERAQCLAGVFGPGSAYDIGHIMAEMPQPDGSQQRPYDTVLPLSAALGIPVDISCQRDDSDCVQGVVDAYDGPGNILICWEHKALHDIVKALGDKHAPKYDGSRFDLIWTDPYPYGSITNQSSQDCPGLDGGSGS